MALGPSVSRGAGGGRGAGAGAGRLALEVERAIRQQKRETAVHGSMTPKAAWGRNRAAADADASCMALGAAA